MADERISRRLQADPPLEIVCELLAGCGLPTADVALKPGNQRYFGIACDRRWLAVIGLERLEDCALLRSLAVQPAERGRGLGQILVAHVEHVARQDGIPSLYLLTTDAAAYFARIGYRQVAREDVPAAVRAHVQFRSLCPASATVLVRRFG